MHCMLTNIQHIIEFGEREPSTLSLLLAVFLRFAILFVRNTMVLELDSWQLVLGGLFAVAVALQGWDLLGQCKELTTTAAHATPY